MGLFGLFVAVAAVVATVRIADFEDESPLIWGLVVVGLILLLGAMPLPFMLTSFLAWIATLVAMMAWKIAQSRRV